MRLLLIIPLFTFAHICTAQSGEPLTTDRPDFTESAITVPKGTVQLEGGATVTRQNDVTETSGSEILIRWSPARKFEFRFGLPGFSIVDENGAVTDPGIGAKVQLGPVRTWDVAVIAATSVPLGDRVSGSEDFAPMVLLAAGRDFGSVGFGTQIGVSLDTGSDDFLLAATAVVGIPVDEKVGSFAELAVDQQPRGTASAIVHAGLTYSVAHLVQLDLHAGLGLTDTAPDYLIGAGLSLRR